MFKRHDIFEVWTQGEDKLLEFEKLANTGLPNLLATWWQTPELKVAGQKAGKSLFSYKNGEWCMLFIKLKSPCIIQLSYGIFIEIIHRYILAINTISCVYSLIIKGLTCKHAL